VIKSGYVITVAADTGAVVVTAAADTCNAASADAVSSYFAEAHPVSVGSTGQRSFATDTRGTIYFDKTGVAMSPGMVGRLPLE